LTLIILDGFKYEEKKLSLSTIIIAVIILFTPYEFDGISKYAIASKDKITGFVVVRVFKMREVIVVNESIESSVSVVINANKEQKVVIENINNIVGITEETAASSEEVNASLNSQEENKDDQNSFTI